MHDFLTPLDAAKSLFEAVSRRKGDLSHLQRILTDENLREEVAGLIVHGETLLSKACTISDLYPIEIDYGRPPEKLLEVPDNFFDIGEMLKHFPVKGAGVSKLHARVVRTGTWTDTEAPLAILDWHCLRPAKLEELAAFGRAYPKMWKKEEIAALGSLTRARDWPSWGDDDDMFAPALGIWKLDSEWRDESRPGYGLVRISSHRWMHSSSFLAVQM